MGVYTELERRGLIAQVTHPEKVKELAAAISTKLREWNSPMPSYRATNKSVPLPDKL